MADEQTRSNGPKKLRRTAARTPRSPRAIQPPAKPPPGYLDYAEYAEREMIPAIRRSFDALLLTYHIRELRGEVAIPRIDDRLHDWQLECEGVYGDGHYAERKRLLYENVGKVICARHADPKVIYAALANARNAAMAAARGGRAIDWRRKLVEEYGKLRDNVEYWAKRLQRWFRETEYTTLGTSAERKDVPQLVCHLDALLEALSTNPFVKDSIAGSLRRRRPGHRPEPWLAQAHQDLARALVRRQSDREDLLTAVGLIPYREHPPA